jgi:hypothetical protein
MAGRIGAKVDEAALILKSLQAAVEAGPALGAHFAAKGLLDLALGAVAEFGGNAFLGATTHAFADIVAVDDQVATILGLAAHQYVDVRIVGVPMIDRHPVESGAEIVRHVVHQLAGEGAQVFHLCCIFRRDDEAEVVPIILAAIGEGFAIDIVSIPVEQAAFTAFAVNAVPLQIGEVPGERCCPKVCALLPDDPRLDDHPALSS